MNHRHARLLSAALLSIAACGGSADSTEPRGSDIRVVAGAGVSDTVLAKPVQALVVEVLDGGRPRPGLVVRFESLPPADTARRLESTVLTSNLAQDSFTKLTSDTTNAQGRASVIVQLGTVAGDAALRVSAPELGVSDTVHFSVRPGTAAKILMTVPDTLLKFGASYSIGAATADRYGNRRSDAVTFDSRSTLATVDQAGKVQAGEKTGRGFIVLTAGSAVDSARFTVIPLMSLTFVEEERTCCSYWLADGPSDGTSMRKRLLITQRAYPSPSPTSEAIAFQRVADLYERIFVIDPTNAQRDLLQGSIIEDARFARYSSDGTYIYFGARDGSRYAVWRVHPDGTGLELLVTTNFVLAAPGISPDGKQIAYSDGALKVRDLATGSSVTIGASGAFPVFSPDGTRVAYLNGSGIVVVNSDGTSARSLTGAFVQEDAGLAWLPDGEWLITRDYCCVPILVNASTGEVLQLQSIRNYYQIAVRP